MMTGRPCAGHPEGRSLPRARAFRLAGIVACAGCLIFDVLRAPVRAENPTVRMGLATAFVDEGRYVDARALFRARLTADPVDLEALVGLARVEEKLGHRLSGEALLARARALAPDDASVSELGAEIQNERYPAAAAFHIFAWGNGVTWRSTGINPTWRANRTAQYGLLGERYVLTDAASSIADDRIGVTGMFGDPDVVQVRIKLLHAAFTNYPDRLDGALDVVGSDGHVRYEAGYSKTGVEGMPSAQDNLVATAAANLQLSYVTAQLGWASAFTAAYLRGQQANFSDGNRYHFAELGAQQDLGIIPFDVEVGGFLNQSGYAFAYPLARVGYYSYAHRAQQALKAIVRYRVSRHVDASATGAVGTSQTSSPVGRYDEQAFQQFEPSVVYTNGNLEVSAKGAFAQHLGGSYVPDYVGDQVEFSLRLRL